MFCLCCVSLAAFENERRFCLTGHCLLKSSPFCFVVFSTCMHDMYTVVDMRPFGVFAQLYIYVRYMHRINSTMMMYV